MCWHRLREHEVPYQALGVQRLLNVHDVIGLLRSEIKRAGSQRAFARKAGVNVSVVSKTLRGIPTLGKNPERPQTPYCLFIQNDARRGARRIAKLLELLRKP